ncbi:MAG TPA: hypothetical protein DEP43_04025 [Ruminococcaceae bacterium]|nr:hypothetical protein [Oscillospiraceae bacterium]HCB65114.1 hypothetical protein [Oscillospiraceae bacterium]
MRLQKIKGLAFLFSYNRASERMPDFFASGKCFSERPQTAGFSKSNRDSSFPSSFPAPVSPGCSCPFFGTLL